MLVHVVADYGPAGDLAFAEVTQRLLQAVPAATVVHVPVGPFDTVAAGFLVAQLALTQGPERRVVFHNVAPRRDETDARDANEGERFILAETDAGVVVVGPNSGHSLSWLKGEAQLSYLDVPAAGSQFRSRDFLPAVVGELAVGSRASVADPLAADAVPDVPQGVVAYADGYGNLKTTYGDAPAGSGERVLVRAGHASATAIVSDGSFAVAEGELAFAPGSSGWPLRGGGRREWYELFLRRERGRPPRASAGGYAPGGQTHLSPGTVPPGAGVRRLGPCSPPSSSWPATRTLTCAPCASADPSPGSTRSAAGW